ncbi:MAG: DNA mismatch repair endonuclease MutL [Nitrospiraceae bacterium]
MSVASSLGKIWVLPEEVSARIAAGEVVERPAAVVKELIDNSLDAGSSCVTVEVTDGGLGLIRVVDDGEGMGREDAALAFQRHATSKLRLERDLSSVKTLGFRGEALPSIASVSKVRVVTACRDEPVGTELQLTGGALTRCEDAAAAPGTQVEVTELFFNTPARRKFLKTTATEFSHICQVVQHASLAWPQKQFRLRHNGQEVLNYPAVASRRDRVLQVYGGRYVEQAVEVHGHRAGIRLEGFTVQPLYARTARSPQDVLVNGRAIKNPTISHAVYDGYGTYLPKGRHPVFVLYVDLDPDRVDVNVHPTKREVRFAEQDLIHQLVRQAIRETVGSESGASGSTTLPPQAASPSSDLTSGVELDGFPLRVGGAGGETQPVPSDAAHFKVPGGGPGEARPALAAGGPAQAYLAGPGCEVHPLGQVSRTFLVAQVGSELQVIDQHTAHERVLFERLYRAWQDQAVQSQPLLIPEPIDVPPHGFQLLQRHAADLEHLGLKMEPFGSHSFLIRSVPALLGHLDYASLVHDLLEELSEWNVASSLEVRVHSVVASLACHGAVRAGRAMELPEIKRLIEDWIEEGLPPTCPHGRRIALRLPTEELSRLFGRD